MQRVQIYVIVALVDVSQETKTTKKVKINETTVCREGKPMQINFCYIFLFKYATHLDYLRLEKVEVIRQKISLKSSSDSHQLAQNVRAMIQEPSKMVSKVL